MTRLILFKFIKEIKFNDGGEDHQERQSNQFNIVEVYICPIQDAIRKFYTFNMKHSKTWSPTTNLQRESLKFYLTFK